MLASIGANNILYWPTNGQTVVRAKSPISGKLNELELPINHVEFANCLQAYRRGALLQDAFSALDAAQREFVKTGITPQEWEEMFGEVEDLEGEIFDRSECLD